MRTSGRVYKDVHVRTYGVCVCTYVYLWVGASVCTYILFLSQCVRLSACTPVCVYVLVRTSEGVYDPRHCVFSRVVARARLDALYVAGQHPD